jgi:hypothetical protein
MAMRLTTRGNEGWSVGIPRRRSDGPGMTYGSIPFFPHRRNRDGTFNSICLTCLATVAANKSEDELKELDKHHVCSKIRKPKIGDRIAIPNHALVFFFKKVNSEDQTVDAQVAGVVARIEENVPWSNLTFIDPE